VVDADVAAVRPCDLDIPIALDRPQSYAAFFTHCRA
jgi:hypothetical protein